ncbi:MAG: glycoside hydrolase family 31 protein, partial [Bacteroidales bacterium]|nr:glycoside hydrolase family 31 protein [Bacteroidales bacterium]
NLIGEYRRLTGEAPMLPVWALGYHQSRNKYSTQEEVLSVAERMRKEKIPMSSIFIDYYYWGKYGTGSHRFDEAQFPDVPGMLKKLHEEYHTKAVITIWPSFRTGTPNYQEMNNAGFLLKGSKALDGAVYDAFNPKAAEMYWKQVAASLIPLGIDGWFLDGPEPDLVPPFLPTTTYAGPAHLVRNLYPLVHSTNFYKGLIGAFPNKRPYLLTRCAWASQQRNSTAVWSGDIPTSMRELKTQITAGLNFVASGIPYWTTDIGGYAGGDPADPAYQETFTRWWQYGVFCPIFRSHGKRFPGDRKTPNELWAYGAKAQKICTDFSNLRYRLLPYIYSLSGEVTLNNYTTMRLLAFDFPKDTSVWNIKDQFMYGPALLVNPVTEPGAASRDVYLPSGTSWVDFWTGETWTGGQTIKADAPISRIPLYVRAGSVIPMGPFVQFTGEKDAAAVELRVYTGADGAFELYEDDGETFDYKNGQFSRIPMTWNEQAKTLDIGTRQGSFKGMPGTKTFHIVWVGKQNGTGIDEAKAKKTILYSGVALKIQSDL